MRASQIFRNTRWANGRVPGGVSPMARSERFRSIPRTYGRFRCMLSLL
jgi:hypothetical protein